MADSLFGPGQAPVAFSRDRKRAAIERELKKRHYVFPRRVAGGKMTQQQADEEIAVFEAILKDYT